MNFLELSYFQVPLGLQFNFNVFSDVGEIFLVERGIIMGFRRFAALLACLSAISFPGIPL